MRASGLQERLSAIGTVSPATWMVLLRGLGSRGVWLSDVVELMAASAHGWTKRRRSSVSKPNVLPRILRPSILLLLPPLLRPTSHHQVGPFGVKANRTHSLCAARSVHARHRAAVMFLVASCTALHVRMCAPSSGRQCDPSLAVLAGTPQAIPRLVELSSLGKSELDLLPSMFPFELDDFQMGALTALHAEQNVVVSSPTGSGKTVVGELACYLALCRGRVAVYTTPLKALSNQKFRDFQRQFGRDRVGLLTGDVSINRDAPVIVMTTEVYRNMLLQVIGSGLE
jgi:hypothetical protein